MSDPIRPGPPVAIPAGTEVLVPFVAAGVFGSYEVQFAATVCRLAGHVEDEIVLALALAARAPRFGHVCSVLSDTAELTVGTDEQEPDELPWPDADGWGAALGASALAFRPDEVGAGLLPPLVWDHRRLYLQRYWHYELLVADSLVARSSGLRAVGEAADAGYSADDVEGVLDSLFGNDRGGGPDLQREAARRGLQPGVSIIAGGPGTGKTHTVARLLAASLLTATGQGRELRVALAAPTGKAAARMGEAVKEAVRGLEDADVIDSGLGGKLAETVPTTVHALLGWRDRTHFRHDRANPLPHEVVIIDETSMISLPLMARLLDAVRPDARLVLVGDPFQLASIEAGSVLSDVMGPVEERSIEVHPAASPLADRITVLRTMRRFDEGSPIASLAYAVRSGDADGAMTLLEAAHPEVRWIRPDDNGALSTISGLLVDEGIEMVQAAQRGEASSALDASDRIKVLAATRRGPWGLDDWTERIERGVAARVPGFHPTRRWHLGRPVLVTANDSANRVYNGDAGVVVSHEDGMAIALRDGEDIRYLAPSRLDRVETWWAMTIHKSQGSEFHHAVVSLPARTSPILTRELLYTAVTRAREQLTVIASDESIRAAIDRPVARASGLRERLWPS